MIQISNVNGALVVNLTGVRVDAETRKQAIVSFERAKQNERFQFVAWTSFDAMEFFLEKHGYPFVVLADDEISYVKA